MDKYISNLKNEFLELQATSKYIIKTSKFIDIKESKKSKQKLKYRKSGIQSLIFSKGKFTVASAKAWAKKHGFKYSSVDEPKTSNTIRLRQHNPDLFKQKSFRTKTITEGIKGLIAKPISKMINVNRDLALEYEQEKIELQGGRLIFYPQVLNLNKLSKSAKRIRKAKKKSKPNVSKFTSAEISIVNISKFNSVNIKSDLDITIPMEVSLKLVKAGPNKDGLLPDEELKKCSWNKIPIIDFHDDSDEPTLFTITDKKGEIIESGTKMIDGSLWSVGKGLIYDRYLAYLIYLGKINEEPLEISVEYKYLKDFTSNGLVQRDITPARLSVVRSGHIVGNSLDIEGENKTILGV